MGDYRFFETAGVTPGYMKVLARQFKNLMEKPFSGLSDEVRKEAVYGHRIGGGNGRRSFCLTRLFQGRLRQAGGDCGDLYASTVCSECHGYRVGGEARRVILGGRHIGELGMMTIAELRRFLKGLLGRKSLTPLGKGLLTEVSQEPIGRHTNSNPATYIGIWDRIRKLFAGESEAVRLGLSPGHFSFNSKGACPACGGGGRKTVWIGGDFSFDTVCDECRGKRYNDIALSVGYKGNSIADVLKMRVSEAVSFFANEPAIVLTLKVLERIGMGYVELGQPAPSLSGGEAQRIKLAKEIGREASCMC